MNFLKKMKIKDQILLAMIIGTLLSCSILGVTIYNFSKVTIENNYKNSHTYNLQVSSNIIDIQLKSIIELGRSVLTNDSFKKALTSEDNKRNSRYFSSINSLTINRTISDIVSHDPLIDGIAIINEYGNVLFYSKRSIPSGYYRYYSKDNFLNEDWVEQARKAKGKEVFYGYNALIPDQEGDTISYVKNLINPRTRQSMGFMVVNISKKLLDKAFGTLKEGYSTNRYMIIDKKSRYPSVYFNGDQSAKSVILKDYLNKETKGRYLFSSYLNESTGWMAVNVIEKSELKRDSAYIGGITLIAVIVLISLSIYISRIISNQISKPLNILEKTIESVGEGSRHIEEEFDNSELGELGNKFKEMVNNNLELRERLLNAQLNEREAELLLLQAQINPHFLYNTLDSLYFMAIIKQDDDIAKMVLALSNTFKLSLNKGDKFITVGDEINRIKEYMTIQNMRYNNRFELFLDLDRVKDYKIITFILQPFVENAMYHGLEAKIGKGYIKIEGHEKDGNLYFTIKDNGVGIADLSVLDNGYGVKNVKERIKLLYGEEYGVSFASEPYVGTTVTIVVQARS
ncbi:sensor histidine kinase [Anaerocolumna sp. AGMB13025]|uniref:sensor histidine kinase n=1 Tax=Anaerocolumna sp. AGMB13025 TaxID=3039116 RepID=UPI00241D3406|nr:sensor histidine kinase [Anaerocolumna sp. AGMB13025]WFR56365.1 sensor histidine kinase [Anaerocolumna sp. AGMB13025]